MYHSESGKGFPVVLIHGFCETHEIWKAFVEELSKYYRVLTPDLPGFGKSPLPENDFTIDEIAEEVFEWLTQLGINKAVIIGHSLGGYVVLSLARYHPEIFQGAGLFHSTAFADDSAKKLSRNKTIEFVNKKGVEVFAHSFIPQLFYSSHRKANHEIIKQVTAIAATTPLKTLVQYTKAMRDRSDRTDVMKDSKFPVLFIGGEKDTVIPIDTIEEQAMLPHRSILHVLKGAGHMGMYEKPSESLQMVADYLDIVI